VLHSPELGLMDALLGLLRVLFVISITIKPKEGQSNFIKDLQKL